MRLTLAIAYTVMFGALLIAGVGPLLWLAKAAVSTTQDTISAPWEWFPSGFAFSNITTAWNDLDVGRFLGNSVIMALGSWVTSIIVTASAAYVLSVLRPRWAPLLNGAILATLFIPGVVVLVPLYMTIVRVPGTSISLLNTFWAVWLPAAVSAFNIMVVKRFFDEIPIDIIEAARIDGAGAFRIFWQIVLPFARPILGVVSVLAVLASWKDFLWPKLVLQATELQPISVALPRLANTTELGVQMAAMFLGLVIPIAVFLLFQNQILRGVSLSGGSKG
ncbi:ABC-type sugar transport system, permease component [Microbacterium sp. HM58-2]|nr:ABC-type sugar transport system, permease component [Microbacterium sp. HM58-2]